MEDTVKDVVTLKEKVHNLEKHYSELCLDVKQIKERLLGRPTWQVSMIITMLSSLCVGLIVKIYA